MANGVAVRLLPQPTSASPSISPRVGEDREGVENQIGKALAAFTALSVQAFQEVQGGKMSAATRSQGGDLIAELYWARAELGETNSLPPCISSTPATVSRHKFECGDGC